MAAVAAQLPPAPAVPGPAARAVTPAVPGRAAVVAAHCAIELDLTAVRDGAGQRLAAVAHALAQAVHREAALGGTADLGVERDTPEGTVAVVVRGAAHLNASGIDRRLHDGDPAGGAVAGGSLAVTLVDASQRGIALDVPAVREPGTVTFSIGAAVERPVVRRGPDGEASLAFRSMAWLAMAYDADLLDGRAAAGLLAGVAAGLGSGGRP